MAVAESGTARRRNPRGQGERLRDDIVEAASKLLADPASPPLTLRAVAREVGVAATSVYLHFADIQSLVVAVAGRRVGGLGPGVEFGLEHPGHYQVMFVSPLPTMETVPIEETPGFPVFRQLIDAVAAAIAPAA